MRCRVLHSCPAQHGVLSEGPLQIPAVVQEKEDNLFQEIHNFHWLEYLIPEETGRPKLWSCLSSGNRDRMNL